MAHLQENRNNGACAASAPTLDQLCGHIRDALAHDGRGLSYTIERIERRAATSPEQRFRAALLVLREQQDRIAALVAEVVDLGDDLARREDEIADLEAEIETLRARLAVPT